LVTIQPKRRFVPKRARELRLVAGSVLNMNSMLNITARQYAAMYGVIHARKGKEWKNHI